MRKADALQLDARGLTWASDCKSLWCTTPIQDPRTALDTTTSSANITYTQANGEPVTDLWVDATYSETLTDLPAKLRTTDLADLPESIRALNAYVAQSIEENQVNTGKAVTRVGANKFYLDRGYVKMAGLRAQRGYFTSIRPGQDDTLLNINPVTSAFLQPILVSSFLRTIKNEAYAGRPMSKATVKIIYTRSNYVGNAIDYNSEAARLKTFVQFGGKSAKQQKFYKSLLSAQGQPRRTDPDDEGISVYDYYTNRKSILSSKSTQKLNRL